MIARPSVIAGALAVAAERLGDDAAAVLSRLAAPLGYEVGATYAALVALEPAVRKRRRAALAVLARAPLPVGSRAVHPSWLEAALATLPGRARTAVSAPSTDPADVWLARWATADLPPFGATDELEAASRDPLAWLTGIGADQLAFALGAPARAIAALAGACTRIELPPRVGQLGPKRAAIARCHDVSLDDDLALVRVASRALAPHLASDELARLQLIVRLPRPVGMMVARELAAHAGVALDQCPTWAALVAR